MTTVRVLTIEDDRMAGTQIIVELGSVFKRQRRSPTRWVMLNGFVSFPQSVG